MHQVGDKSIQKYVLDNPEKREEFFDTRLKKDKVGNNSCHFAFLIGGYKKEQLERRY